MTKVIFNWNNSKSDKVEQGDFVFCESQTGAGDFWGIYSASLGTIINLKGGGDKYIQSNNIYLGETYSYWKIAKIVKYKDAVVKIEEHI